MTLFDGKFLKTYKISNVLGDDAVARRFLELGFTVGQKVKIVSKSLQKKVFLIELRGYLLSVRAELLKKLQVEE